MPPTDQDELFDNLDESSRRVDEVAEKIRKKVRERIDRFQEALAPYKEKVTARTILFSEGFSDPRFFDYSIATYLAFGKFEGKWDLFVEKFCDEQGDVVPEPVCLLVDAPEETQVCGVEKFNDLLAALKKEQDLKYERLVK